MMKTKVSRDGMPRPGIPTGYMSFWVRDIQAAYDWLVSQGSKFPVIPAINNKKGIDPNPGYTQVLATDTESVDFLCTMYTGT